MANLIGSALSGLADEIPGVSVIEDVIKQLDDLVKEVSRIGDAVAHFDPARMIAAATKDAHRAVGLIEKLGAPKFSDLTTFVESSVFKTVLSEGLGLNASKIEHEAPGSVKTIDDMIGFAIGFPLIFAGMQAVLKFFGAQRVSDVIGELFGRLPEELGVNWAIGMFMNSAMEAAVGNKFSEAIMRQKRPNAPDWRILRLALKQHLVSESQLTERMAAMGFSDDWIRVLKSLGETLVPVGDLQQLYLYNLMSGQEVKDHLGELGFRQEDAGLLYKLYIDKAQTQAGVGLRSVARELFRNQIISEGDYHQILTRTNMPAREVDDDIEALALEKQLGRLNAPVSALKTEYVHGKLDDSSALQALQQLGYTSDAAQTLLNAWKEPRAPHPMTASKVLSYWASGVITDRNDAHGRLLATGLRSQDADFLLDHPSAGHARRYQLTPSLLTNALIDDVISQEQYHQALSDLGLTGDVLERTYQVGLARKARRKPPPGPTKPLDKAEVLEAMKFGIIAPTEAQTELEHMGYSTTDALTLIEIRLKGQNPFITPQGTAGMTLPLAIAYMEGHGYQVIPPPDPQLVAAEGVLALAGYSWQGPTPGGRTGPGLNLPGFPVTGP